MKKYLMFIAFALIFSGCKKLTQVPEPVNTITTTETFGNDGDATSAIIGIYNDLSYAGNGYQPYYGNSFTTFAGGQSADELINFNNNQGGLAFQTNTLNSSTNTGGSNFFIWNKAYFDIYIANAAINALPGSAGVDASTKKQLLGEAQFLRAFCYFYLVNFYGAAYTSDPNGLGVPLVTTTAYAVNDTMHRSPTAKVYQLMVNDLKSAQSELADDYSVSDGQRIRANAACATALLARVYLYMDDYKNAYTQANAVITNNAFSLQSDLNQVFLPGSTEAILQWETPDSFPWATIEGHFILPGNGNPPTYYLTSQLVSSFQPGDKRFQDWVDTTTYSGQLYYYPYKYKVYQGTPGNITENYMVLRLAEQYLIRAEAQANGAGNGLPGAISDLNKIRVRAGLAPLSAALSQSQIMAALMQERRIELFSEWGHRWFDLKRTGQAQTVLSADKGFAVPAYQLLYPIPANELIDDNNLVQNPGY